MKPTVTAVGRILKSKHGEARIHHVIAIDVDGTVSTRIKRVLKPES
jgi:hypothetical protein